MLWESSVREIDDFERSSLAPNGEYVARGDSMGWGPISTFPPLHGDRVLHAAVPSGGGWGSIISEPGDGLGYYPEPGDTFHVGVAISNVEDATPRFGWASSTIETSPSAYYARVNARYSVHLLEFVYEDTVLASEQLPSLIQENTWYDFGVTWGSDNTFDISLSKHGAGGPPLASITHHDTSATSQGGVVFTARHQNDPCDIYFDHARKTR